ncbi:MAG: peptidase glycoprotease [Solirubrobacterales bacterium]|nr:peptidase glycoprotease [Solirubrobacterales bacterium]
MLVIDTATPATVVGVVVGDEVVERRHDPLEGERPGHVGQVLALAEEALAAAGTDLASMERIGVGVGPGSFTGMRIGIATARALAHATGLPLAAVSTLGALAVAAGDEPVLAVLDARRGEAFVALWAGGRQVSEPRAVKPADLVGAAAGASLAVGDGAVRFREQLEPAGVTVPQDGSPLHRVGAAGLARLARQAPIVDRDALLPEYVRSPDAKPRSEQ